MLTSQPKWNTVDYPTREPKWFVDRSVENPMYGSTAGKELVGKQIGVVKVRKPLEHTRKSYETAAWWMKLTSDTGEFPVILTRSYYSPYSLMASVTLPATVDEGFFPALWCGNMIGKSPYVDRDKGKRDEIGLQTLFSDACLMSANKGGDVECLIDLDHWQVAIDHHETRLKDAYEKMPYWWGEYQKGEDEFFSRVGMVAHNAESVANHCRYIGELKRNLKRWQEPWWGKMWCFTDDETPALAAAEADF